MSGLSRAARHGVILKGGAALERLAAGKVLLFDKTGTLTRGRPALTDVITAGGWPPTRSCGWRPASTRPPRTCSPRPSSPRPATAA
jgi:cation transport ATPase